MNLSSSIARMSFSTRSYRDLARSRRFLSSSRLHMESIPCVGRLTVTTMCHSDSARKRGSGWSVRCSNLPTAGDFERDAALCFETG